jgi:serine/threonine-protein kinase
VATRDSIDRLTTTLADRYRVVRELGRGGMATVYLAHDLKHDRDVAIKVLHEDLGATLGPERFLAEIKTTAKLQHPHILPLLDSGDAGGLLFYVMPYVAGETLRDRLARETQLPIEDAIRIAREVADALGFAHGHGIVHRDIKPENILLQGGHALVADFGIALAVQHAGGARLTQTGLSLGTPQYMAPEQAMGEKTVGPSADIYALGAVTYEMLTGEPPFTGANVQAIVAKVMSERPTTITTLRDTVPDHVNAAVLKALAKLPADRHASATALADALADRSYPARQSEVTGGRSALRNSHPVALAVAGLSLLAVGIFFGYTIRSQGPAAAGWTAGVAFEEGQRLITTRNPPSLALSADGETMVYTGPGDSLAPWQLWLRRRNELAARPIPGTARAMVPALSPDAREVAFLNGAPSQLYVLDLKTGVRRAVSDLARVIGGLRWGTDGFIYFVNAERGISRVPGSGGPAEVLTRVDTAKGEYTHRHVELAPDNSGIAFTVDRGGDDTYGLAAMRFGDRRIVYLGAGSSPHLLRGGGIVAASPTGQMFVARFTFDTVGLPTFLPEDPALSNGALELAIAANGNMAYVPDDSLADLEWWWADGRREKVIAGRVLGDVAVAADGQSIFFSAGGDQAGIWAIAPPERRPVRISRLRAASAIALTADERHLVFVVRDSTAWRIVSLALDGSNEHVVRSGRGERPSSVGRWTDDQRLVMVVRDLAWKRHKVVFTPDAADRDSVVTDLGADEDAPRVAPDGRHVAFSAGGVYVNELGTRARRMCRVSDTNGVDLQWALNGRRLFFRTPQYSIVSVDLTAGGNPCATPSRDVIDSHEVTAWAADPRQPRILVVHSRAPHVEIVPGWAGSLKGSIR